MIGRCVLALFFFLSIFCCAAWANLPENTEKVAEVIKGECSVREKRGEPWNDVRKGTIVNTGNVILTQKKSVTIRLYGKITKIKVERNSELEIVSKSEFKVLKGEVKPKVHPGELIVFELPWIRLATMGTEFLIRVKTDATYVGVSEGEIKVKLLDSESEQMTTLTRDLMLRATPHEPLKIAPLPKKSQTPKWITIGACAAVGVGSYILIDYLAGGTDPVPTKINSLQDAINAANYIVGQLDTAHYTLQDIITDPTLPDSVRNSVREADGDIGGGKDKAMLIRDGGENMRNNMKLARNMVALGTAAGIVYSTVRLFRDRDVYRGIEERKWWVSFDPKLLGDDPSMKLALNVRF